MFFEYSWLRIFTYFLLNSFKLYSFFDPFYVNFDDQNNSANVKYTNAI